MALSGGSSRGGDLKGRRLAMVAAAATASIGLFWVSRGKWSDALIDSGREWIVPDALARGELLYRDVVYWFGPFTPYFQALFFKVFGSGLQTLVLAGDRVRARDPALPPPGTGARHRRTPGRCVDRPGLPLLIFMPDAGGAHSRNGISHVACRGVRVARRDSGDPPPRRDLDGIRGGSRAGLAGLCRTEWGVAVGVGAAAALALRASGPFPFTALAR